MDDTKAPTVRQQLQTLPAFKRWSESFVGKDGWRAYQAYASRVEHMLTTLVSLWPEFVEYESLIVNKDHLPDDPKAYIASFRAQGWSSSQIEEVINHIHMEDLFLNDPDRDHIDQSVFYNLAQTIAEIWRCRLSSLYPDRRFMVRVTGDEHSPEVCAFTIR